MNPEIKIIPGKLPEFWDRNVLFFCNMQSVFFDNKEQTEQLISQIYGAHSYGTRVMSILNLLFRRGPNKIFLEAPPEPNLLDYLSGYLGLSLPSFEVLSHREYQELAAKLRAQSETELEAEIEQLKAHPAQWIDGYVTDPVLVQIARHLHKQSISTSAGSKNGNNKYLLHLHQIEQQLPVFETFLAAHSGELPSCLENLRRAGYRKAVVKAQIGASGLGMIKVITDAAQAKNVPEYLFFEGPCLVQGWLDESVSGVERVGSPSVQMFLNDTTIFLFDWTEQILSGESVHEGNVSPPPYVAGQPELEAEIFRQASIGGAWLHAQGYRGTASTDFLVVSEAGVPRVYICEINARVTGATYPSVLARHFMPEGCWSMRNIQFRKAFEGDQLLSLMDRAAVLYRPGDDKGIIPFNFNIDAHGKVIKGQFLCLADTLEACSGLLNRAWTELPVEWDYDRD